MKTRWLQTIRVAFIILLLTIIGMTNAFAQKFTVDRLKYSINDDGRGVTVTGHVDGQQAVGQLNIPSSVIYEGKSYPVKYIGGFAFAYSNLTGSLVIPNSVSEIGDQAFGCCWGFTGSLVIPNSVTAIGVGAFDNCGGFTGSLVIPNSVTKIGTSAFEGCSGLSEISIPKSVIQLGMRVFEGTGWYNKQPDGILYLDNCCLGYKGDKPIGDLKIQENTRLIAAGAFYECRGLTGTLILPNTLKEISTEAFSGCSGLTGPLSIPNTVISIGSYAFYNCSGFNGSLSLSNSLQEIGSRAFAGCKGFKGELVLPESLIKIGESAFENCSGFSGDLILPEYLDIIGVRAFMNCSSLTGSLVIPNKVSKIEFEAFKGCCGFNGNLRIGNSVTYIGNFAFAECNGFKGNLTIPSSVTLIESCAFQNCNGFNGKLTIENPKTKIADNAFKGCNNLIMTQTETNATASNGTNTNPTFSRQGLNVQELSVFHEGMAAYENSNGKWGYMDRSGKAVIPCIYQDARRFSEGLAAVQKDGYWGYINKNGETVIPFRYLNPYPFHEGYARVYTEEGKGKNIIIDNKGNVVPNMPDTHWGFLPFSEGLAVVRPNEYKCYYIDKQGKRVTKDFIEARPFSEGLAAVCDETIGRWGFIDKTGKIVIPCQYSTARPFREGLAAVDGGYIDKTGNWVIPPKYVETSSFENGFALVIKDRTTVCVINKSGKELYDYTNQYDNFNTIMGFSNGIAAVYNKGAMFSDCFWLTFNTKCKKLTKEGYSLMMSYMDLKYEPGKNLLEFNGLANESLFRANEEDNFAVCWWHPKWNETSYFYLDNQGNRH